jgi:hypothetical protein
MLPHSAILSNCQEQIWALLDDDPLDTPRMTPQHAKDGFTGAVDGFTANGGMTSDIKYAHLFISCNSRYPGGEGQHLRIEDVA